MHLNLPVVLASASPRRHELLQLLIEDFKIDSCEVDESPFAGETPACLVLRLAEAKARAIQQKQLGFIVVGADTIVVCDGRIMGKPGSKEEAREMLQQIRGKTHEVFTGLCVLSPTHCLKELARSEVTFNWMSESEINEYLESGEPFDKAGAYAIQGFASRYIQGIKGCYFNVVGLPIALLYNMLQRTGFSFHG
jgi:septum formation protein